MITIVGLGPGSVESLTLGTVDILKNSANIYLRTEKHPTVKYLRDQNIKFKTYDTLYETEEKFEDVYKKIAQDLVSKEHEYGNIVYAVPGHPLVAEKSVTMLLCFCRIYSIKVKIVPAVSFIDAIFESIGKDIFKDLKIIDAFDIKPNRLDKRSGIIITQIYSKFIASDVKLALMEYYKYDIDIYFIRAAGIKGIESIRYIKLYELDRQDDIDYLTSVYIPKDSESVYDFIDLLDIMDVLRGDNGCPWDKKQNHKSLKKCLIEESYEVIEAIEDDNYTELIEELGDVLFQVVFHSQIGKEEGFFNINDITNTICKKMIERHPHVFGGTKAKDSNEVTSNWEEIKKRQQGLKTYTQQLRHIPKILPALMRACKVQEKASKVGLDFNNIKETIDKTFKEYNELKCVYSSDDKEKIVEKIGNLIFAIVNIARFLDIDPEFALNYTIEKFIKRFAYIENKASCMKSDIKDLTYEEMNKFWEETKNK